MEKIKIRIDDELIERMMWLSKLRLDEQEREKIKEDIRLLLNYISDILEINVSDTEELLYPNLSDNVREDIPSIEEKGREHLGNAVLENGFVKAPKVFKGE